MAGTDAGRLIEGGDDFLPTHAVVIRSPMVVSRAIESVGLRNLPMLQREQDAGRDPVLKAIESLSVNRPDRLAKVLRVDYLADDRQESIQTVRAITEAYQSFLDENYRRNSSQIISLISKARDELRGELETLEQEYFEFRQKNSALATDEHGRTLLNRRLDHWDRAGNEAMVREVQVKAQLALGRKLVGAGTGLWSLAYALNQVGGEPGGALVAQAASISQSNSTEYVRHLSQEQQQLAERYGPQYTKVRELQEQIARVQERMRDARNRLDQAESKDLLSALEESLKSIEQIRTEIRSRFETDMAAAKKSEADVLTEAKLHAGVERQRMLFNTVVDQLKQAQLTSDFTSISAQTIEAANAPVRPVRPRVVMTLLVTLLGGCSLGIGVVLLVERIDSRIRSSEEMRGVLGYPVLGQIPQTPRAVTREVGLITHTLPRSPMSEAYKMIRTRLDQFRRRQALDVILVTSPHPGDGKSVTASNLAMSFAHVGRRTLLVDADLRRPRQDWIHRLSRRTGLAQVLEGALQLHRVVQRSPIPNLDVVTAGPEVDGPAELLTTRSLDEFFAAARSVYDIVVVDSPPILAVTDASILGPMADGIVLVVRDATMRHRDAGRVVELLESMGTPVLGTVVNRTDVVKSPYTYGYGPDSPPAAAVGDPKPGRAGAANRVSSPHGDNSDRNGDIDELIP